MGVVCCRGRLCLRLCLPPVQMAKATKDERERSNSFCRGCIAEGVVPCGLFRSESQYFADFKCQSCRHAVGLHARAAPPMGKPLWPVAVAVLGAAPLLSSPLLRTPLHFALSCRVPTRSRSGLEADGTGGDVTGQMGRSIAAATATAVPVLGP
jgi:hypothetical protein